MILAAATLPVIALLGVGVSEWGNAYLASLAIERAAATAAGAVADRLAASDLLAPAPPAWAGALAESVVRSALPAAEVAINVRWATPEDSSPTNPIQGTADVPVQDLRTAAETLDWIHTETSWFRVPQYSYDQADRGQSAGAGYLEGTTYPGWSNQGVGDTHDYADQSLGVSQSPLSIVGVGTGGNVQVCLWKFCWSQRVWVIGTGSSTGSFVTGAWTVSSQRTMGSWNGGVWVPWDWQSWWSRRTATDRWTQWDRWLAESGRAWWSSTTLPAGGLSTIGPYARVVGQTTTPGLVRSPNGVVARRTVLVEAQVRIRSMTPLFRSVLPASVRREGRAQAERTP